MENMYIVKKVLLLVIISNVCINLYSQENSILKGRVLSEILEPVDFFNIMLLSPQDSTLIKGGSFFSNVFEIKDILPGEYLLRISSVQYQTKDTLVMINHGINDLNSIILKEIEIQEIIVYAKRPLLKQQNGDFTIDIGNTFLKNESSVMDILRKSPSVMVDNNNNISVFDKENTTVYINDKEVRSQAELDLLQPSEIDNIQIIRNPSSQYRANTNAVIRINTKRKLQDVFNISISNSSYFGRKYSDMVNFAIVNKINKVSNYFSYNFSKYNNIIRDISDTYIFREQQDTTYFTRSARNKWEKDSHNIFYSFDYEINKKSLLGFQYTGFIVDDRSRRANNQRIYSFGEREERKFDIDDKIDDYLHNLNLNYKYNIKDDVNIEFLVDYAISGQKMNSLVDEYSVTNDSYSQSSSSYKDNYHIFSSETKFHSSVFGFNYDLGAKYSLLSDRSIYSFNNTFQRNNLNDHILGFFLSAGKKISTFTIEAGLRTEYTSSNISFKEDNINDINNRYWDIFPNVTINNKFSDKVNISLSYSRKINRPSFSRLNPRYKYLDSLSYMIGNPLLKPAYNNLYEINIGISKLTANIAYRVVNDYIVNINTQDSENSNIIKYSYINLNRARYLSGSIFYSIDYRDLSNMFGILVRKPYMTIPYQNTTYKVRKPIYRLQYTGNLKILKETSLTGAFIYQSSGEDGTLRFGSFNNLSFGINQYLFNKKLFISANITDILDKYKTNNWKNRTNNVLSIMDSDQDSRKFYVTIRYNFGILNLNGNKKSSNTDNINRR